MPYGYDKPGHALGRLGVFKRFADVPNYLRLGYFEEAYRGRDVLAEYDAETGALSDLTELEAHRRKLATDSWRAWMDEQGRHHALADPSHVIGWVTALVDGDDASGRWGRTRSPRTVYTNYWRHIARFYRWLTYHVDHPHSYDPFLMAAVVGADGPVGDVWRANLGNDPLPVGVAVDDLRSAVDGDADGDRNGDGADGDALTDGGADSEGVLLADGGAEEPSAGSHPPADDGEEAGESGSFKDRAAAAFGVEQDADDPLRGAETTMRSVDPDGWAAFDEYASEALQRQKDVTVAGWRLAWKNWVAYMDTVDRHPACPSEAHVREFAETLVGAPGGVAGVVDPLATTTAKRRFHYVGKVFEYLNADAHFPAHSAEFNPFEKVSATYSWPSTPEKQFRRMNLADAKAGVARVGHVRDRAILVMQFKLGLRAGEVRNLRLSDLSLTDPLLRDHYPAMATNDYLFDEKTNAPYENAVVIMYKKDYAHPDGYEGNKSERVRVLPLDAEVRRVLVDWLLVRPDDGQPYVFLSKTHDGQLIDANSLQPIWEDAFPPEEWGETDRRRPVKPHYGRRYFTTHLRARRDVNEEHVKFMRGDRQGKENDADAMNHYIHVYYEDVVDAYRENIFTLGV